MEQTARLTHIRNIQNRFSVAFGCLLFGIGVVLLLYYVLLSRNIESQAAVYRQEQLTKVVEQVETALQFLLAPEEKRPFADYSFFTVSENTLLQSRGLTLSPLARRNALTTLDVQEYFMINPEGGLYSPLLPDIDVYSLVDEQSVFDEAELSLRTTRVAELRAKISEPVVSHMRSLLVSLESSSEEYFRNEASLILDSQLLRRNMLGEKTSLLSLGRKDLFEEGVVSVEVRLSPFMALRGEQGEILFFRGAILGEAQYVQGFVVQEQELMNFVAERVFDSALRDLRSVLFFRDKKAGVLVTQFPKDGLIDSATPTEELRTPLDFLEVGLVLGSTEFGVAQKKQFLLFLLLGVTLTAGLFGAYRLVSAQLDIAYERANFVSAVTHELRTPLTSIRMYAEMLTGGMGEESEKRKEYSSFILQESERLSRLINNVLRFTQLSGEQASISLERISVAELAEHLKSVVEPPVKQAGFELHFTEEEGIAQKTIKTDLDACTQIVMNLIDNALKFSSNASAKTIELTISEENEQLVLSVRDFGPGISQEEITRIFEPFYRAGDELIREQPGVGLGLSLVYELTKKIGAEVSVVSEEPGVRFSVQIPL